MLELGCLTCARRVSDGFALATHMKLTVGTLLFMTCYVAQLAEIRAVPGEMIVTAMSADHTQSMQRCRSLFQIVWFCIRLVSFCGALPPGSVDVIPTAGCAQCARCSLLTIARAFALGASDVRTYGCVRVCGLYWSSASRAHFCTFLFEAVNLSQFVCLSRQIFDDSRLYSYYLVLSVL